MPDVSSLLEASRAINMSEFEAEVGVMRRLNQRRRLIAGLAEAFEKIPDLEFIRCLFGKHGSVNAAGRRLSLTGAFVAPTAADENAHGRLESDDELAERDARRQAQLEKALQPMRKDLGSSTDTYENVSLFFRHSNVVFHRDHFMASLDILLDVDTEQLSDEVLAKLEERRLDMRTQAAPSSRPAPRL